MEAEEHTGTISPVGAPGGPSAPVRGMEGGNCCCCCCMPEKGPWVAAWPGTVDPCRDMGDKGWAWGSLPGGPMMGAVMGVGGV